MRQVSVKIIGFSSYRAWKGRSDLDGTRNLALRTEG